MTPPNDRLPTIIEPPNPMPPVPAPAGTYIVPALITAAGGDQAAWRYVEFFTANINNDHTRRAYAGPAAGFRLVRTTRTVAHADPAVRRGGMGETVTREAWGGQREDIRSP